MQYIITINYFSYSCISINIPKFAFQNVTGEVYEVDDEKLAVLDKLEAHPDYYQRDFLEIEFLKDAKDLAGKSDSAMAYFLKNFQEYLLDLPTLGIYDSDEGYVPPKDRTEDTRIAHRYEVLKKKETDE